MKAVIYARYSGGPRQTDQSIEGQVTVCKKFIRDHGYKYTHLYADRHISGRTDNRPEFQQMIEDGKKGKFDVLVLYSSDRFSRDRYHSAKYKKILKDHGVKIQYAAESIPETPEGILLESLMEGWAQYYSEELSRKVKRGMTESALKCKANGTIRPWGYIVAEDKHYIIDPDLAPLVKKVFDKYLEGETMTDIANWLNARGYTTHKGKDFTDAAIRRMLENERYIGTYKWGEIVIPDGMPAIIDQETFKEVQMKLEKTKKRKSAFFPLQGKLVCKECGAPYYGVSGTSKSGKAYYYYKPSCEHFKNIRKDKLERTVIEETKALFFDTSELKKLVDKLEILLDEKRASMVASETEKAMLRRLDKEADEIVDKMISYGDNPRLMKKLEEKLAQTEAKARSLQDEIDSRDFYRLITRKDLEEGVKKFLEADDKMIPALIHKVVRDENNMVIYFNVVEEGSLDSQRKSVFVENLFWWADAPQNRTIYYYLTGIALQIEAV